MCGPRLRLAGEPHTVRLPVTALAERNCDVSTRTSYGLGTVPKTVVCETESRLKYGRHRSSRNRLFVRQPRIRQRTRWAGVAVEGDRGAEWLASRGEQPLKERVVALKRLPQIVGGHVPGVPLA